MGKKKAIAAGSTPVRIDDDLVEEIDLMRSNFGFKVTRPAFIGSVIRAGIPVIKQLHSNKNNESTLKK